MRGWNNHVNPVSPLLIPWLKCAGGCVVSIIQLGWCSDRIIRLVNLEISPRPWTATEKWEKKHEKYVRCVWKWGIPTMHGIHHSDSPVWVFMGFPWFSLNSRPRNFRGLHSRGQLMGILTVDVSKPRVTILEYLGIWVIVTIFLDTLW